MGNHYVRRNLCGRASPRKKTKSTWLHLLGLLITSDVTSVPLIHSFPVNEYLLLFRASSSRSREERRVGAPPGAAAVLLAGLRDPLSNVLLIPFSKNHLFLDGVLSSFLVERKCLVTQCSPLESATKSSATD